MKSVCKFIGVTAISAVIIFLMAACGGGGGNDITGGGGDITGGNTHTWSAWTETTPATCTEPAQETRICVEDPTLTETRDKPGSVALGHLAPSGTPATCTTAGNTGTGACTRCSEWVTGETIPAFGHAKETVPYSTIPVTCLVDGSKTYRCVRFADCNYEFPVEVETALGHDESTKTVNGLCARAGCTSPLLYAVGNPGPGGGTIYYVSPGGFTVEAYTGATTGNAKPFAAYQAHYLEAAPSNSSASAVWSVDATLISGVTANETSPAPEPFASTRGNGRKDTYLIVEHLATTTETGRAAQLAVAAGYGGKDDWFLPSPGEGIGGIPTGDGGYWTSSQYNNGSAWTSSGGAPAVRWKYDTGRVRAVRAF